VAQVSNLPIRNEGKLKTRPTLVYKSEGRLRFRKRPSYEMAVSRILSPEFLREDDHLSQSRFHGTARRISFAVVRRYPRINPEIFRGVRTGCPPSVLSCTAWGFSCLANYSASGELLPRLFNLTVPFIQRTGGVFSVTLSVTAIRRLPDRGARVFYAACRRMVFGLSSSKP